MIVNTFVLKSGDMNTLVNSMCKINGIKRDNITKSGNSIHVTVPGVNQENLIPWRNQLKKMLKTLNLNCDIRSSVTDNTYSNQDIDLQEMRSNFKNLTENDDFTGCVKAVQNQRKYMEDTYTIQTCYGGLKISGVFDGHGGPEVSKKLSDELSKRLCRNLNSCQRPLTIKKIENTITKTFLTYDRHLYNRYKEEFRSVGSTAVMAIQIKDHLFIAHTGDSRGLLFTIDPDNMIYVTDDHVPERGDERSRIENSGGKVRYDGYSHRINKTGTNVSRGFGDFRGKMINGNYAGIKSPVSPLPFVHHHKIKEKELYLVLASDGLIIKEFKNDPYTILNHVKRKDNVCANLIKSAIHNKRSKDNISVLVSKIIS
jgi:serine/threonine protein phosphatase PrpC